MPERDREVTLRSDAIPPSGGWFRRAVDALTTTAGLLGAVAIVVITFGLALDVLLRTIRGQGLVGIFDAVGPILAIAAFLGLGITEAKGEHIALNIFVRRLGVRARNVMYVVGTVLVILMVAWMAWAGFTQAMHSLEAGEVRPGIVDVPLWPARFAVVIGCVILILQLLLTLADAARGVLAGKTKGVWIDREND